MIAWTASVTVLIPMVAAAGLWCHRRRRDQIYSALAATQADLGVVDLDLGELSSTGSSLAAAFSAHRLVRVEQFVMPLLLARLRKEALSGIQYMDKSFIPLHKQGRTLSYERILRSAPNLTAFYHSDSLLRWISALTGTAAKTTPVQDQSSLSVLCYMDAGDHIGWHYDHNFYRGRHFTVLLTLANRSNAGGVSGSRLERQLPDGTPQTIDMPEGTLVVFEGNRVRHRVTAADAGDLRVILSMTYCHDPRISRTKELARRIKDTAFFGPRALWD